MILLRLADLLDMSKDRVSINVLRQNIEHMPEDSKFHWISHMAIDKCDIRTEYQLKHNNTDSYMKNGSIKEVVIIDIYLNTKLLTKPTVSFQPCQNIVSVIDHSNKTITIGMDDNRCSGKCNFLCKWMSIKHDYLYQEFSDLQKYLNRNSNNLFDTEVKILLHYHNSNSIPPDYIDIIGEKINS